jgi:hypothetical protein
LLRKERGIRDFSFGKGDQNREGSATRLGDFVQRAFAKINESRKPIQKAKAELLKFLSSEI